MSYQMTIAEREAFLADVHVGVLSISQPDRGPLTAPVWYDYSGGDLWFLTGRDSRKGRLLAEGTRVSLCAQTETVPYRYVVVEGPVTSIETGDRETHTRPMARRYLGEAGGDAYVAGVADSGDESILATVRCEHWLTVDYGKRG